MDGVTAILTLTAKIRETLLKYLKDVKHAPDTIGRLQEEVKSLQAVVNQQSLDNSRLLLQSLYNQLETKWTEKLKNKWRFKSLKRLFERKYTERKIEELEKLRHDIARALQVDDVEVNLSNNETLGDLHDTTFLQRFPTAQGALLGFQDEKNPTCLKNTRVEALEAIREWTNDSSAKSIFWLNGMAADLEVPRDFEAFQDRTHHGVGNDDIELISRLRTLRQFERLVLKPLKKEFFASKATDPVVLVIDGLDECGKDEDVRFIIDLFASCTRDPQLGFKLKCLISSRPELPVRHGFRGAEGTFQELVLHEIPAEAIEHDIATLLEHELWKVRKYYNELCHPLDKLPSSWPGARNIEVLVKRCVPSFTSAETVCRLLNDQRYGNPDERLNWIIGSKAFDHGSKLEAAYMPVLSNLTTALTDEDERHVIEMFRDIVGPMVALGSALTIDVLSELLSIPKRRVKSLLSQLHSVLHVPVVDQLLVRLLHRSFGDFLINPNRQDTNPFWVDQNKAHSTLAENSLRVMKKHLHEDICRLILPGTRCSDIDSGTIEKHIPSVFRYACLHWVSHMQAGQMVLNDDSHVVSFLEKHLLHWLEAMSLLGSAPESLEMLGTLQTLLHPEKSRGLQVFLLDAMRVVRTNLETITDTPLQIYSSVLVFTPKNSPVRRAFEDNIPRWISMKPHASDSWDQREQISEGHANGVNVVVFSPDGKMVASASSDATVRLWRSEDGTCIRELKGHTDAPKVVVFSSAGILVASASLDSTVQVWRTGDGALLDTFQNIDTERQKFNPLGASTLTNVGVPGDKNGLSTDPMSFGSPVGRSGVLTVSSDGCWIQAGEIPILWIPISFRGDVSSVSGSTVAIDTEMGKVIIMRFGHLPFLSRFLESPSPVN
ncbi:uncharacterized protein BROUX77_006933 [Berkeleyomyces rouxiae]|uniref:uncharacterized protein n=1 Tax=Berkeleyomyces rouxiae TaxID=2035830 RepID=UPI003B7F3E5E